MSYFYSDQSRGNYRNYYSRRRAGNIDLPPDQDERIHLLIAHQRDLFRDQVVLDIGCNSGAVSIEIAQTQCPKKVIGVDIDLDLIRQCGQTVRNAFSIQFPDLIHGHPEAPVQKSISTKRRKLDSGQSERGSHGIESPLQTHHFPTAFPNLYGPISIPSSSHSLSQSPPESTPSSSAPQKRKRTRTRGTASTNPDPDPVTEEQTTHPSFPRNLVFYGSNWHIDGVETDEEGYDLILALSLTKWIHLHHGDAGLLAFFQKCFRSLKQGGKFILEKQSWRGYVDAKRTSPKLRENFHQLKLRPEDDFERILLEDIGFVKREGVKDHVGKGYDRSLEIYYKA